MKGQPIAYSDDELAYVEAMETLPRELIRAELVAVFGRTDLTPDHVRQLCKRRRWLSRTAWTAEEDMALRRLFPHDRTDRVAAAIGRSYAGTHQRATKLGLRKDAAYLASEAAGRIRKGERRGTGTEFREGHVPANKGLRRSGWSPGRMASTQFKKGVTPRLWMPIGSTRLVDGYEYTKVSDVRNVAHTVNWKPTHHLRWQAVHGPIPKGHALKCLDGNRLNTDPVNWACVPRGVLARLNGGRRKKRVPYDAAPPELKPTVMALAQLEHAVYERKEHAA